jgi:hypothetical protein
MTLDSESLATVVDSPIITFQSLRRVTCVDILSLFHIHSSTIDAIQSTYWRHQITQNPCFVHISTTYWLELYRVFTKEWCGFKNLLNDYILQLDGAPLHFHRNYNSYSIVFSNSSGSDVLQMETTTYTYEYYMGRIRLSCGCVSCDPGCTHWRIMINL